MWYKKIGWKIAKNSSNWTKNNPWTHEDYTKVVEIPLYKHTYESCKEDKIHTQWHPYRHGSTIQQKKKW